MNEQPNGNVCGNVMELLQPKKRIFTWNTSMATVIHEDDKVKADMGTEYLIQVFSMHELFFQT